MDTDTKIERPDALRLAQFDAARREAGTQAVRFTAKVRPYIDQENTPPQPRTYVGQHRPETVQTKVIRPDAIAAAKVPDEQVAVPLPARAHGEEMRRLQGSRSGKADTWAKFRNGMSRRFRP